MYLRPAQCGLPCINQLTQLTASHAVIGLARVYPRCHLDKPLLPGPPGPECSSEGFSGDSWRSTMVQVLIVISPICIHLALVAGLRASLSNCCRVSWILSAGQRGLVATHGGVQGCSVTISPRPLSPHPGCTPPLCLPLQLQFRGFWWRLVKGYYMHCISRFLTLTCVLGSPQHPGPVHFTGCYESSCIS